MRVELKLVLGVRPRLDDLAYGAFRGLGRHIPFGLFFLWLLGLPIPMLLAVGHDLLL